MLKVTFWQHASSSAAVFIYRWRQRLTSMIGCMLQLVATANQRRPSLAHEIIEIQQVTLRQARLILGWVAVCGQVHHLGM